jgi:small subunit ribosomal protein S16
MSVVIRMTRIGTNKKPRYRIVAADSKFPRDGRNLEILGSFNPFDREKGLVVKADKISAWIKKGAKPSNTVAKLLKNAKVQL